MSAEECDEEHSYVYLDFHEKLTSSIFSNKMFLRIANLDKEPMVQINDLLFKGTYDECVGTNIFFEEIQDAPPKTNIFETVTPIRLRPTVTQTKVIKLKQLKLPRKPPPDKQAKESIILNLNQDYQTVLKKLEQGALNLEDLAEKSAEKVYDEQLRDYAVGEGATVPGEPEKDVETLLYGLKDQSANALLEAKYERLKRLARRPVKRMKLAEDVEEPAPEFQAAFEYHNLERQICQSSDAFRTVSGPIFEKNFIGGIDVERCILQGLLPPGADFNHVLTREEQRAIFTIDNFENLSLPARYLVLKEYVAQIEELIENTSPEELKETDESGRTISDISDIFRRLVRALEQVIGGEGDYSAKIKEASDAEENYIKYRHNPDLELFQVSEEIFNTDEWFDAQEGPQEDKEQDSNDSDDSSI